MLLGVIIIFYIPTSAWDLIPYPHRLVWYHHQTQLNLLIDPLLSPATYSPSGHHPQAVLCLDPNQKGLMEEKWRKKKASQNMIHHELSLHIFRCFLRRRAIRRSLYPPHGCSSERQGMAWSCSQLLAWAKPWILQDCISLSMSRRSLIAMNVVWDPVWFPRFFCVTHPIPLCNSSKIEKHSLCSARGVFLEVHTLKEPGCSKSDADFYAFFFFLISTLYVNKCAKYPQITLKMGTTANRSITTPDT